MHGSQSDMIYLNENVIVACLRNMQNVIINAKLCIVSFLSQYINVSSSTYTEQKRKLTLFR